MQGNRNLPIAMNIKRAITEFTSLLVAAKLLEYPLKDLTRSVIENDLHLYLRIPWRIQPNLLKLHKTKISDLFASFRLSESGNTFAVSPDVFDEDSSLIAKFEHWSKLEDRGGDPNHDFIGSPASHIYLTKKDFQHLEGSIYPHKNQPRIRSKIKIGQWKNLTLHLSPSGNKIKIRHGKNAYTMTFRDFDLAKNLAAGITPNDTWISLQNFFSSSEFRQSARQTGKSSHQKKISRLREFLEDWFDAKGSPIELSEDRKEYEPCFKMLNDFDGEADESADIDFDNEE